MLALLSLLKRQIQHHPKKLFFLGVFGAGLLLGDGMLTPSISVISALEGIAVISPEFSHLITPMAFIILLALFGCQKFGTEKIGFSFGPIILLWFITIAILGGLSIYNNPVVLEAINPYYGYKFAVNNGLHFLPLVSGIFLVITGAEAMYADLGHFGKTPIRLGWFCVALPSVLLNYFGQGAYALAHPADINNLFYSLAPSWFIYPLVILATLATIIASQAVITASFSLIHQAISLNIFPRLLIKHTSSKEKGQIYIPHLNTILAIGTLSLVLIFKKSSALAAAYGIAVNLVMIIVAILVICVARLYWRWSVLKIISIFSIFMLIDLLFLVANIHKIEEGGWIPLAIATGFAFIMFSWREGILFLRKRYYQDKTTLNDLFDYIESTKPMKLKEVTNVFITNNVDQSIGCFLHYLKINRFIPAKTLIINIVMAMHPFVPDRERYHIEDLSQDIYKLTLNYGFMQTINIPQALIDWNRINSLYLNIDPNKLMLRT
ncbi:KUP/HAK/KT family potassium transporter [Legionella sp. km772]|uniref:KUP/HAK/KT family potassium transporter n=1 Tax=Legionella sp. km772 TaxID=2498111 RepID=UPI001F329688|nr:KUP/HAK/KT family potassium transporter [Legionella sp. km772]